jgi:hypothetical protein
LYPAGPVYTLMAVPFHPFVSVIDRPREGEEPALRK